VVFLLLSFAFLIYFSSLSTFKSREKEKKRRRKEEEKKKKRKRKGKEKGRKAGEKKSAAPPLQSSILNSRPPETREPRAQLDSRGSRLSGSLSLSLSDIFQAHKPGHRVQHRGTLVTTTVKAVRQ
jgi:hypothetical protein